VQQRPEEGPRPRPEVERALIRESKKGPQSKKGPRNTKNLNRAAVAPEPPLNVGKSLTKGRTIFVWLLAIAFVSCLSAPAYAADRTVSFEISFLAALLALVLVGRLLGEVMSRVGQPSVMGQLLAGMLLGPSVLGLGFPGFQHWLFAASKEQIAMLDAVSQVGILLLLLLTGMETDLKLVRKVGKAAISISGTGVAVPFAFGVALGWMLPESVLPRPNERLLTSLFLGTCLAISSIKIVAVIVREMEFSRRNLGQIIVGSAILEDTIGWMIIAITFSLAAAGSIDVQSIAQALVGTALFLIISFTVGRRAVAFAIRWANDNFESDFSVVTVILVVMIAMALTTHFIGVHTVLGAFVAGVLIGESPILTKHIDAQLRGLILAFFMPVFFGTAGLNTDLSILTRPDLLLLTFGLIVAASLGKFGGAFLGAEIGGLTGREALAVGCAMNARGSTEVIVAAVGLSMGALSSDLYTMIVAMAFVTTMAMPPMLRWSLSRVPLHRAERKRLEQEALEAKEFVPNLERLLLAVDNSPSGQFASHMAGLLASRRGMPITVLPLLGGNKHTAEDKGSEFKGLIDGIIKQAASTGAATPKENEITPVEVVFRTPPESMPQEAITVEAKKGYDLLLVGIEKMKTPSGDFTSELDEITAAFEGPLATVLASGKHLEDPTPKKLRVLVPITGTGVSRRAAEIACSLGKDASITALYVGRSRQERRQSKTILDDVDKMASRYKIKIDTRSVFGTKPANAILAEVKGRGQDLIVMGVDRRPREKLYFGETPATILARARCSLFFFAT
jgi:Kef-type K+ transport system membrane component KefB/nucleotide-binding universal stress UspA family protein